MDEIAWPDVVRSFVNCSQRDRSRITMPPAEHLDWSQLDYLGWRDRRQPEVAYLVTRLSGAVTGLVMRAATRGSSAVARKSMCAFCLTVHQQGDVALFAARRAGASGRNGNTVGTYICADLACSAYARGLREPGVPQPHETLSVDERVARLGLNVARFVSHVVHGETRSPDHAEERT